MRHFPKPIALPKYVFDARKERHQQVVSSALRGISIRFSIVIFELVGFFFFRSSSLLMDAVASIIDLFFSVMLIVFIKLASKPPDKDHPFGHGRYEPLVGLQLAIFMVLIGIGVLVQQSFQLHDLPAKIQIHPQTWIIPCIALILLEICYQIVIRVAKKQHSPALFADAWHYRADSLTSLFATVTLAMGSYFPSWSLVLDHLGAIFIALFMIVIGVYASRDNLNQLLDHIPDKKYFKCVRQAALNVKGVLGTEKMKIQLYGPDAHIDIDIEVEPNQTVEKAHQISQQVRAEIQKEWPAVKDVIVHIEPYYPNDHSN